MPWRCSAKYGDEVRVLKMGDFSIQAVWQHARTSCTGDIGFFKIVAEGGVATGVRRIEAVTGEGARWPWCNSRNAN